MDRWTEIRSAYYVAKLGTVSSAAAKLGLHRATLMRHIDTLEEQLSVKLFQRHPSGYTPTDFGASLFEAAERAESSFADFERQIEVEIVQPSGDLIVTSTAMFLSTLMPVLECFQVKNPEVRIKYNVSHSLARLEVGEAHLAVRTGPYELMDDSVMLPLARVRSGLYAHKRYIERYGQPADANEFGEHRFISRVLGEERFRPFRWLIERIEPENVVFMSNDMAAKFTALLDGIGIGFMPIEKAKAWPDLIEVLPHNPAWDVDFWVVTHVDNHRMPKVQALLAAFREMGFLSPDGSFADILPAHSFF
ncbi:MAG: LysR family transcriptional regulator [Pseudomonadota bacterium]